MGVLDRLRMTFRWKADDLDAAGLGTRIGASALTLGGLLKHMAINEDFVFTRKLTGEPVGEPWEVRVPTTLIKLRSDDKLPAWKKKPDGSWVEVNPAP